MSSIEQYGKIIEKIKLGVTNNIICEEKVTERVISKWDGYFFILTNNSFFIYFLFLSNNLFKDNIIVHTHFKENSCSYNKRMFILYCTIILFEKQGAKVFSWV